MSASVRELPSRPRAIRDLYLDPLEFTEQAIFLALIDFREAGRNATTVDQIETLRRRFRVVVEAVLSTQDTLANSAEKFLQEK